MDNHKKLAVLAILFGAALSAAAQYSGLMPAPGVLNMGELSNGINAINFGLPAGSEANRGADLFVTVTHDGELISVIPASNSFQIQYDALVTGTWSISFFLDDRKVTTPGEYVVTLPQGLFLTGADKTPSEEKVLTYTVPQPIMVAEPVSYTVCTSIQDITLTFPGAVSLREGTNGSRFELFNLYASGTNLPDTGDDDDTTLTPPTGYFPEITIQGNKALLHYPVEITTNGTWKIEALSGALILEKADGSTMESPETHLFYIIPNYSAMPTTDPYEGNTPDFPGEIYLDMAYGVEVDRVNGMAVSNIYSVKEDGSYGESIARYKARTIPNGTTTTRVILENILGADKDLVPAPGNYDLVTGEQLYHVKGMQKYISKMTFHYTVVPSDIVKMEFTPEKGSAVRNLQSVKVTFPDAKTVELGKTFTRSWMQSPLCNYECWPAILSSEPNTVEFRIAGTVTYPGEYRLTSSAGSVLVDGKQVTVVADYIVNGTTGVGCLQNVTVLPEIFDIHTVDGVVVARRASVETLNSLPAGIYIAAGQKIAIR